MHFHSSIIISIFFVEKNNNNIVASQNEKYRQITRPDGKRISLLIQNFQPRDCGIYRCVAINPLTRERKYSPDAVNLKIISKCSFFYLPIYMCRWSLLLLFL